MSARLKNLPILVGAAILFAAPAWAQQAIPLEDGKPYVHPHSGIGVPAELGGIDDRRGIAFAEDSLDVGFAFDTRGNTEALSVYIFRNTNGAVPIWFAQAQSAALARDKFQGTQVYLEPTPFAPPGQSAASGLQAVYSIEKGDYRSTGLAMFAIGDWYVKVRASSQTRSPQELQVWMSDAIASLELPEGHAAAVMPVTDCEEKLRFRGNARDVKSDDGAGALGSLLGSLLMSASEDAPEDGDEAESMAEAEEPVVWCRDRQIAPAQATYRANASEDSYLFAFGDNGNGIRVAPDVLAGILGDEDAASSYAVTMITASENISYVSQDRIPSPSRVIELINNNRVIGSSATWGDDRSIQINSGALD